MPVQSIEEKFPEASKYVRTRVFEVCAACNIEPAYWDHERWVCRFRVRSNDQPVVVLEFSEENMEDFDPVIKNNDHTDYGLRFRSYIDFKIYIELGKAGVNLGFRISDKFVQENRKDWWKDKYVPVSFGKEIDKLLYEGLKGIEIRLAQTLSDNSDIADSLTERQQDLDRLRGILGYYESHEGSLDETAASIQSLRLLKAAAIWQMFSLENRREGQGNHPDIVQGLNNRIYSIAEFLRNGLFLEIEPPSWLKGYVIR